MMGYKINLYKSTLFLHISNKQKTDCGHSPIHNNHKENKISRNKSNQESEEPL